MEATVVVNPALKHRVELPGDIHQFDGMPALHPPAPDCVPNRFRRFRANRGEKPDEPFSSPRHCRPGPKPITQEVELAHFIMCPSIAALTEDDLRLLRVQLQMALSHPWGGRRPTSVHQCAKMYVLQRTPKVWIKEDQSVTSHLDNKPTSLVALYWSGRGKLWKVYWLYGVIGTWVIGLLGGFAAGLFGLSARLVLAIFLPYNLWVVVSVWRCAFNGDSRIWGYIARVAVLIGFSVLLYEIVGGRTLTGAPVDRSRTVQER